MSSTLDRIRAELESAGMEDFEIDEALAQADAVLDELGQA
jgi:hypothetical protein